MPEISRFLGIKIFMYFNEHNPPHFHVEYNEYKTAINIKTFGVMEGKVPSKVLGLVVEWAEDINLNYYKTGKILKQLVNIVK